MHEFPISGLHHVTAVCDSAQENYDFYTGILGLQLVKQTVNFDDPRGQHLYYGDGAGTPGSILTFFPMAGLPSGREGTGQVSAVAFAVSEPALDYWQTRLAENHVAFRGPMQRFDEVYVVFEDPDGLQLELVVADQAAAFHPSTRSSVPAALQLRGFHSVTLAENDYALTHALLSHQMGWTQLRESSGRTRYQAPGGGPAALIDVLSLPAARHGLPGAGTVHHIAFRVADAAAQSAWRESLVQLGYHVSPIKDRGYFQSIYYREPGGVLFEIATDTPGFALDESPDALGSALKLPPQFEAARAQLEKQFPVFPRPAH
jgi:glyoxalase family protein